MRHQLLAVRGVGYLFHRGLHGGWDRRDDIASYEIESKTFIERILSHSCSPNYGPRVMIFSVEFLGHRQLT